MRIISRKTLLDFWTRHVDAEQALTAWHFEVKHATWRCPADVVARFPYVSVLPNDRLVFNIKGNAYRLVVAVNYGTGIVYVRFVGAHAEYDRVDAETI